MDKNLTIRDYVRQFMKAKAVDQEPRFYMSTLDSYVEAASGKLPAPGSVARILRMLRQDGEVRYEVINKARALYLALPLTLEQSNG